MYRVIDDDGVYLETDDAKLAWEELRKHSVTKTPTIQFESDGKICNVATYYTVNWVEFNSILAFRNKDKREELVKCINDLIEANPGCSVIGSKESLGYCDSIATISKFTGRFIDESEDCLF